MKLYSKRFIRNATRDVVSARQETRDALLWDVLPDERVCRVMVQGSDKLIITNYPENWGKVPSWLKRGNVVKIMHTGGVRGKIEVIGHGQLRPTLPAYPIPGTPTDGVLVDGEGSILSQSFNNPRMAVLVAKCSYRIGGTNYTLGEISMQYGDNYKMGDGGKMGTIAGVVGINVAPGEGLYRYDLISVGADKIIDYTPGSASASPVKPSAAAGHVTLGYVFVPYGTTAIFNYNLNQEFVDPEPQWIEIVVADDDLAWEEYSTSVTVKIYNQYNNLCPSPSVLIYITLEFETGNGTLYSSEEGSSETKVGIHTNGSTASFTYTRLKINGDSSPDGVSPLLKATLVLESDLTMYEFITIRDALGNIMM